MVFDIKNADKKLESLYKNLDEEIRGGDDSLYFDSHEIGDATVKCRKMPVSVIVSDLAALNSKFAKMVKQPDKKAIKKALEGGEDVYGANLSEEVYKLVVVFEQGE